MRMGPATQPSHPRERGSASTPAPAARQRLWIYKSDAYQNAILRITCTVLSPTIPQKMWMAAVKRVPVARGGGQKLHYARSRRTKRSTSCTADSTVPARSMVLERTKWNTIAHGVPFLRLGMPSGWVSTHAGVLNLSQTMIVSCRQELLNQYYISHKCDEGGSEDVCSHLTYPTSDIFRWAAAPAAPQIP